MPVTFKLLKGEIMKRERLSGGLNTKVFPDKTNKGIQWVSRPEHRPNQDAKRLPENEGEYIHRPQREYRPDKKTQWVRDAYSRGLEMEAIVVRSGLSVNAVFAILDLNPIEHNKLFERLQDFRRAYYQIGRESNGQ
jgi:hypothetical protein